MTDPTLPDFMQAELRFVSKFSGQTFPEEIEEEEKFKFSLPSVQQSPDELPYPK